MNLGDKNLAVIGAEISDQIFIERRKSNDVHFDFLVVCGIASSRLAMLGLRLVQNLRSSHSITPEKLSILCLGFGKTCSQGDITFSNRSEAVELETL